MKLPPLLQGKTVPSREESLIRQEVRFNAQTWKARLAPDDWPNALELLPRVGRFRRVNRGDVFALAAVVETTDDAVRAYVGACVWGTGLPGMGVARRVRPLSAHGDAGERLLESIKTLRADGAVAAYQRLDKGGDLRLVGLGPAFFTKLLYFSGWDKGPGPQPLILDQFVVKALNEQAGFGWQTNWTWTADQYHSYLETAAEWADAWGTTADVVELALFEHGKALSRPNKTADKPSR